MESCNDKKLANAKFIYMENKEEDNDWKLKELKIEFKPGYEFQKTKDRYEGKITFRNDQFESFTVKISSEMTKPYLDLIAEEVVKSAGALHNRLKDSLIRTGEPRESVLPQVDKTKIERFDKNGDSIK